MMADLGCLRLNRVLETFFREQLEAIRMGMGTLNPRQVPRFVI